MKISCESGKRTMSKSLLITGSNGFIGTALRQKLALSQLHHVKSVTRSQTLNHQYANEQMHQTHLHAPEHWAKVAEDIDVIIHLSALTDLKQTEASETLSFQENVLPILSLIDYAKTYKRDKLKVIFFSTVTIFGIDVIAPVTEMSPCKPITNYDHHKLIAEQHLRRAHTQGILQACTLRLSNIYGFVNKFSSLNPNRGILNSMLMKASKGDDLTVFGAGHFKRDFLHIEDLLNAICLVIESNAAYDGSVFLTIKGQSFTLYEAFNMIAEQANKILNNNVKVLQIDNTEHLHPIERRNFSGVPDKLSAVCGWQPKFELGTGIRLELNNLFERSPT